MTMPPQVRPTGGRTQPDAGFDPTGGNLDPNRPSPKFPSGNPARPIAPYTGGRPTVQPVPISPRPVGPFSPQPVGGDFTQRAITSPDLSPIQRQLMARHLGGGNSF